MDPTGDAHIAVVAKLSSVPLKPSELSNVLQNANIIFTVVLPLRSKSPSSTPFPRRVKRAAGLETWASFGDGHPRGSACLDTSSQNNPCHLASSRHSALNTTASHPQGCFGHSSTVCRPIAAAVALHHHTHHRLLVIVLLPKAAAFPLRHNRPGSPHPFSPV